MAKASPVLARVYRGPRVESSHRGAVAVADESGTLVASCGDGALPVYARSAAKPFQVMPLLLGGGEKAFRLGDAEIALMCASHGGEPRHVPLTEKLLKAGGFRRDQLLCGAHMPMHDPSARELIRLGKTPSALHNNCSGNTPGPAGVPAAGWPTADYTDPGHPFSAASGRCWPITPTSRNRRSRSRSTDASPGLPSPLAGWQWPTRV